MITINKIEPPTATVIFPNGEKHVVNEYEFNDLRVQIKENNAEGFKVVVDGVEVGITPIGQVMHWNSPFGLLIEQLDKITEI